MWKVSNLNDAEQLFTGKYIVSLSLSLALWLWQNVLNVPWSQRCWLLHVGQCVQSVSCSASQCVSPQRPGFLASSRSSGSTWPKPSSDATRTKKCEMLKCKKDFCAELWRQLTLNRLCVWVNWTGVSLLVLDLEPFNSITFILLLAPHATQLTSLFPSTQPCL